MNQSTGRPQKTADYGAEREREGLRPGLLVMNAGLKVHID